jgi:hypothetical protein
VTNSYADKVIKSQVVFIHVSLLQPWKPVNEIYVVLGVFMWYGVFQLCLSAAKTAMLSGVTKVM